MLEALPAVCHLPEADYLNDIQGFHHPGHYGILAALHAAGIARGRLIIDPGSATSEQQPEPLLTALAGIGELKARLGVPIMVRHWGHCRSPVPD